MKPRGPTAVLMGGPSGERAVSLRTGAAVTKALTARGIDARAVDAGPDLAAVLTAMAPAAAFVCLHGTWGEDGCVQGLLEWLRIPYTHSGVTASAVAMDKPVAKALFRRVGLPVADDVLVRFGDSGQFDVASLPPAPHGIVVKPAAEGSSLGMTILPAPTPHTLAEALAAACAGGRDALIEAFVPGRELSVAVLYDEPLGTVEIVPERPFYDYAAKYTAGTTTYHVPAPLDADVEKRVLTLAVEAQRALGCRGVTRTDIRLTPDGYPFVLEVNTVPGMTETSLVPKIAAAAGIGFEELCLRILHGARLDHSWPAPASGIEKT